MFNVHQLHKSTLKRFWSSGDLVGKKKEIIFRPPMCPILMAMVYLFFDSFNSLFLSLPLVHVMILSAHSNWSFPICHTETERKYWPQNTSQKRIMHTLPLTLFNFNVSTFFSQWVHSALGKLQEADLPVRAKRCYRRVKYSCCVCPASVHLSKEKCGLR